MGSDGRMKLPGRIAINTMYSGTRKGCAGRQLMADLWTSANVEDAGSIADDLPKDFWVDLALSLRRVNKDNVNVAKRADVDRYLEKMA